VVALPPWFGSIYAALFTFAHRALCAAAIRLCPVAEMVLFGFAVLVLDQRFVYASLIRVRPLRASCGCAVRVVSERRKCCGRERSQVKRNRSDWHNDYGTRLKVPVNLDARSPLNAGRSQTVV
jgi:hypothetical protein